MHNFTLRSRKYAALLVAAMGLVGGVFPEPAGAGAAPTPTAGTGLVAGEGGSGGTAGRAAQAGSSGGADAGGGGTGGSSSACADCDADEICDESSGECVECLKHTDCDAPLAACAEGHCVRCTEDSHCPTTAPACSNNTCVECTDSDLHCGDDTPFCDVGAQRCRECLSDGDCTDPAASRCNSGSCVPCTEPLHCEHLQGLGICDTSSGSGECVQCTGTSFEACGISTGGTPYVCDSASRTCTDQEAGSALTCQPCVSDAHCATGRACMQTKFGNAYTGNFCLWRQDASGTSAPKGNCGNVRPYIGTEAGWSSVDGQTPTVCKPRTSTCQAQTEFSSKACSGPTPAGHAECGATGLDDAYCAPFLEGYFCTVPCVSYLDCKDTRPGDDMECRPQTFGAREVYACQFE